MSTRLPRVLVVENEPRSLDLIRASLQQRGFVALEVCDGDEALLARARGPEYRRETHYVHLYVAYLRQKIEPDLANPRYILTKRGLGYSFRALAAAG